LKSTIGLPDYFGASVAEPAKPLFRQRIKALPHRNHGQLGEFLFAFHANATKKAKL
jgi:hypothetical protein